MLAKPSHISLATLSLLLLATLSLLLLTTTVTLVGAHSTEKTKECVCIKQEHHDDHDQADLSVLMRYKVGAIVAILVASAAGVFLPIFGRNIPALRPELGSFFLVKAFSAGIILCTAFIHILPEAFENLTSPCLGEDSVWVNFPFSGLAVMVGVLLTLMMGSIGSRHTNKTLLRDYCNNEETEAKDVPNGDNFGHNHNVGPRQDEELLARHRITSQVLEIGVVVHSVAIGISMGTSQRLDTIKPLIIALSFHQFFEGIGLGGCIVQASFKSASTVLMALFFAITTPLGIAIGIGLTNVYDKTSSATLIGQGLLNAVAAGILIYMALVDLLVADFMDPKIQTSTKLFFGAKFTMFLGVACMAVLAIWA